MSKTTGVKRLVAAASAVWPSEWVAPTAFARYVSEHTDPDEPVTDEALAALYLVCACLQNVAPALKAFESQYLPDIRRAGARTGLSPDQQQELAQALREELLVGRSGTPPSLRHYRGRGDLHGWLRVTATRAAVRLKKRGEKSVDPELDRLEARATDDDPELSYMKALYRQAFRSAFRAAVLSLESREKTLLHQYAIEGLTIDELGEVHGVHRATAARWVQAAREKLLSTVKREFAAQANVSPRELASALRLVESRLEVTMGRLLG